MKVYSRSVIVSDRLFNTARPTTYYINIEQRIEQFNHYEIGSKAG